MTQRRSGLQCPLCRESFALDWRRYFRSPFGRHTCPSCEGRSRLAFSLAYVLFVGGAVALFAAATVGVAIWVWLRHDVAPPTWYVPIAGLVGIALLMPLDRWAGERLRPLVPIAGGTTTPPMQ